MTKYTALHQWHKDNGGKMVDFSGWEMPINYGSQTEEHHAVRRHSGMFDVSHMTIVDVNGQSTRDFLRKLLANDVAKLDGQPGKALYTAMLNEDAGVIDDLIVYNLGGYYRLIVNCATREKDLAWLAQQAAEFEVSINERDNLSMIAVQGPEATAIVSEVVGVEIALKPFTSRSINGALYAHTGYTGERGLEIIMTHDNVASLWQALFDRGVRPCGLGARDTLRLEAGMNLYGHEMDESTSPLVANMAWTLSMNDRYFIGKAALESQQEKPHETLVGLVLRSKGVLRQGQIVHLADGREGVITSGSFSPTLACSIALARIPKTQDSQAQVAVRDKMLPVDIVKPQFVRHGQSLIDGIESNLQ